MAHFVELTQENGAGITVNVDHVATYAPLGGDSMRGTAITFSFAAGDKMSARVIRVTEPYGEVAKRFMAG